MNNIYEYDKNLNLLVNLYNIDGVMPAFVVRLYFDRAHEDWILITNETTTRYTSFDNAKEALLKHVGFLTDVWSY